MSLTKNFIQRHSIFILIIVLVIYRVPKVIWPGRFWAEEGLVYFSKYFNTDIWNFLFSIDLGYYSLFNKIAVIVSAGTVPLEFAPFVTALFAMAATILPAWILLYSCREFQKDKLFVYLSIFVTLFIQPNQEVWINTINTQFYLCISTAFILITHPRTKQLHCLRLLILILSGMTGVVSCLIFPFFWADYFLSKNRNKLHEVVVLTAVCLIQIICVLKAGGRETELNIGILPCILFIKQFALPIFGASAAGKAAGFIKGQELFKSSFFSLLIMTPYFVTAICIFLWGGKRSWYLFFAGIFIASISCLKSAEAAYTSLLSHLSPYGGGRYYFAPNIMVIMSLFVSDRAKISINLRGFNLYRIFSTSLICIVIFVGFIDFISTRQNHKYLFEGPSWQQEVKNWKENKSDKLRIWPEPWIMTLPRP